MPWTERISCDFEAYPDGDGNPSFISITFVKSGSPLWDRKQIGSLFFPLKKGIEWAQAEDLARQMNQFTGAMCIKHLACGEGV